MNFEEAIKKAIKLQLCNPELPIKLLFKYSENSWWMYSDAHHGVDCQIRSVYIGDYLHVVSDKPMRRLFTLHDAIDSYSEYVENNGLQDIETWIGEQYIRTRAIWVLLGSQE